MIDITLPESEVPALAINPKVLVLYGPPKVGKTTLLSKLKGCLVIDTQNGTDYVSCLKIKTNDLASFDATCEAIIKKNRPYKYVAIDVIDEVESWSEGAGTAAYKLSSMGFNFKGSSVLSLPNGAGYLWLRQQFQKRLDTIYKLADHVILIGHLREKLIGSTSGAEVSAHSLDLTGKCKAIVCSQADAIGYVFRSNDGKLMVTFKSKEQVTCGSRCEHLKGAEFEFDWGSIYK